MGDNFIYINNIRCERKYNNLATKSEKLVELFKNEKENLFAVRRGMNTLYICNGYGDAYNRYNKLA